MNNPSSKYGADIQTGHHYVNLAGSAGGKPALKISDYLGHLLFIATAFNWFLVFVLMQIHGDVYVTEVTPIRELEIGLTGIVCGFAFVWFLKRVKVHSGE